jgi:glycosyltransferase involved in cell wall biosynthesis
MGVPVHCLDGARGAGWAKRLRSLADARGVDVVHAHSPVAAIGARLALRRRRPALVYTEHNEWSRYHRGTYWGNVLTYPRNDHVFAVSHEVRRSIRAPRALTFLRMPPVETLYHGIDPEAMASWTASDGVREEFGLPPGAPLVATVANFKVHKGHGHLLEAAAIVRRELPEARFVLVGTGPLEQEVRRRVNELGLDETVIVAGFRDDAPRIAAASDLFVLPSVREGLPIALLEAMALGRPVVATATGGAREVVEEGTSGLLVPPAEPRELARGIVKALGDATLRRRLGEAAQRRAARFDVRGAVTRMQQVYEESTA